LDIEWQYDEALIALRLRFIRTMMKPKTRGDEIAIAAPPIFLHFSGRFSRQKHGVFFSGCSENNHPENGNHILQIDNLDSAIWCFL
jgi:hypothetical protein